jgi:4-amino-4-deoxy-L-arabinose transferase-like glycosyltransferase
MLSGVGGGRVRRAVTSPEAAVAGLLVVVLLVVASEYGWHRDELYFVASGRRPAWGYPDNPPLAPAVAGLSDRWAPGSLVALRLWAALCAVAIVVATARMAALLGGDRVARGLAAAAAAVSAVVLTVGHLWTTTTPELAAGTVVTALVLRAAVRGDPWPLLWAGPVLGLGILAKPLAGVWAGLLLLGLAVTGPRRLLRAPHVWAGLGVAGALATPYLVWQARRGWPQREMTALLSGRDSWWEFLAGQLLLTGPLLVPLWVAGAVALSRRRAWRPARFVVVAYLLGLVLYLLTEGRGYYLAVAYPPLLAAGAVVAVEWARSRVRWSRARGAAVAAAVAVTGAVSAVAALPVLPAPVLARSGLVTVAREQGEQLGWPELVTAVGRAWATVPAAEREHAVVVGGDYGVTGAVEVLGPPTGLPGVAYSGHNGYGAWGPPPAAARAAVLVGLDERAFPWCSSSRRVAVVDNALGVANQAQGTVVRVCRVDADWGEIWPRLRYLG